MDLALTGGTIYDPASGKKGRYDVGFSKGRISAIQEHINSDAAQTSIDVTGKTIVPGLIDLHTHVYHGGTSLGVHPDNLALEAGVTTFVDAGSAGPGNFLGFHDHVMQPSRSRILAFLNISYAGIYGFDIGVGECQDMKLCDPELTHDKAREYADHIIGVKVRVGHFTSGDNLVSPLIKAKEASDKLGKPLMSHIDNPPPTIEEVVQLLGAGDILTHCFRPHANAPITESGSVKKEVLAARDRGVVFDVGHGRGALGFGSATRMLELGFDPDVISSDVHSQSINGPAHNLLHVMSKFMALGMSFEKVVELTTIAPARAIDQTELGRLSVGALGDVTILHEEKGRFEYFDVIGERVVSDSKLVCDGLVVNGAYW